MKNNDFIGSLAKRQFFNDDKIEKSIKEKIGDFSFQKSQSSESNCFKENDFKRNDSEKHDRKLVVEEKTKKSGKSLKRKPNQKKKKFVFLCFSRFFLVCLLIGIFLLIPFAKMFYDLNKDIISEKFFGKKSAFQGILRLWNVDSFEGGTASKSSFLEKISMLFEKENKGSFVKVENMTEDEVVASIKAGSYPDLVCFGTGMSKYFERKLVRFEDDIALSVLSNFYGAGLQNGKLVAIPIMTGVYSLICSSERIERANKDKDLPLSTLAFALASERTKKNKTTFIPSLTFGTGLVSPLDAFSRKFRSSSVVELSENHIVDEKYNAQTLYQAYESFALKKSSMLLGTQRDVVRMQNRVLAGKESDILVEPIGEFTDLVQYVGILCLEKIKLEVCRQFVSFLLAPTSQRLLRNIGMFSVTGEKLYDDEIFKKLESVVDEHIIVRSTF